MIARMALTCALISETLVSTLPNLFKMSSASPPPPLSEPTDEFDTIFYADTTADVNIQQPVAEENFCRTPSLIRRERDVCEPLWSASADGEAVDHASFALGSPRATGAVRATRWMRDVPGAD
jgi:hypothetical protein